MKNSVAIVIPAYNPNEELYKLIKELEENEYTNIIVINDGSKEKRIFENIKRKAKVIEHKQNIGKGQALKTGFAYCLRKFKNIIGIITVDADGQHKVADINKLYEEFTNNKESLILGSRCFRKRDVPVKSRIGNIAIRKILNKKTKYKIQDTQTGLRAIPIESIKEIIDIDGNRFEYEMKVLLYFINKKIEVIEVPIETIYINKNKKSNFRALVDSIKIYKAIK